MTISIDGLVSGLNTSEIIEQLMDIERRPVELLEARIKEATNQQTAYLGLAAKILGLSARVASLALPSTFNETTLTSSDLDVLAPSGSVTMQGAFTFTVQQMAQSSQVVSNGFIDQDTTPAGEGTLSIEIGNTRLDRETSLEVLNGGNGINRGRIRITDRSGASANIDLSTSVTAQDIIDAINANETIGVTASISSSGSGFTLTDTTGQTSSNLIVAEVNNAGVAQSLGLFDSVASDTLTGQDVLYISDNTPLGMLNDGNGIRSKTGDDFTISLRDGVTSFNVNISSALTVENVLDAINNATGNPGTLVASINGNEIQLVDSSTDNGANLQVTAVGSSNAALDLGILKSTSGGGATLTLSGDRILSGMNTVLLRSLNGGSGIGKVEGSDDFRVTLSDGTTFDVDIDSAETLQDVFNLLQSGATGAGASEFTTLDANNAGNGLYLVDGQGGSGNLTIAALNGSTAAADLGIEKTGTTTSLVGDNANLQFIGEETRLADLNGNAGVAKGSIKITDSSGAYATIDLSQETTIADVLLDINGAAVGVTASINSAGDGIIVVDDAGGSGLLKIEEVNNGTTARDLNIRGEAASVASNQIDGSFEFSIDISATDTLEDVRDAINNLNLAAEATIINAGGSLPYRLSIIGQRTGLANQLNIDNGTTDLTMQVAAQAQDAVLFYGALSGEGGLIPIVKSSNTVSDVIPGLSLSIKGTSATPVTITSTVDPSDATGKIQDFVDTYNEIINEIASLTSFNTETYGKGLLFGDGNVRTLKSRLSNAVTTVVTGTESDLSLMAQVGITLTSNGKLFFDSSVFAEQMKNDSESVVELFTASKKATPLTALSDLKDGLGVSTKTGDDFRITLRDGSTVSVDVSDAIDLEDVINAINNDSENDGRLTASITDDGVSLQLADTGAGTGNLQVNGLNSSTAHGGLGLNLALSNSNGVFVGSPINPTGSPGWAKVMEDLLDEITDQDGGLLTSASDGLDNKIEMFEDSIERLEERLDAKEARLRSEFASLELALSKSQNTLERLTQQFSSLQNLFSS
ncbi:MAG: flagellar filament capping protein FliD [Planctomycetota bacterium]